uniref:Uncharacterized protein n=1 Tax=Rhizophora mucronata TaxID=61149 RepID=A0A2P2JFK9_RHIMU
MSGVLELSYIFYFVVSHLSGQKLNKEWHRQFSALSLISRGTPGLKFLIMQRTLSRKCLILILSYGSLLSKCLVAFLFAA